MRSSSVRIVDGPLASVDLVELGAATGLLWRSPETTLVGLGAVKRITVEHGGTTEADNNNVGSAGAVGFVTLPFDRSASGVMLVPEIVLKETNGERVMETVGELSLDDVAAVARDALSSPVIGPPSKISVELDRSADSWRDDIVAVARDRIANSDLQKAVLARLVTLRANSDISVRAAVTSLASRFDHVMLFAIDGFIGASPELLVSRKDRTVRAHPLAGTAARSADSSVDAQNVESLLASSKDRVEHQITIDWLLTELLTFCSYVDAEPEPSVLSLANVHHLGTLVEGVLSEPAPSILELVAAVHPTPALGGAPQAEALALIAELEGFDRGRYGGPTGWVDAEGNGEFAVSVRTAQIDGHIARVIAGVGVVAQSDPQAELEETQAKFRAMLGTLLG